MLFYDAEDTEVGLGEMEAICIIAINSVTHSHSTSIFSHFGYLKDKCDHSFPHCKHLFDIYHFVVYFGQFWVHPIAIELESNKKREKKEYISTYLTP